MPAPQPLRRSLAPRQLRARDPRLKSHPRIAARRNTKTPEDLRRALACGAGIYPGFESRETGWRGERRFEVRRVSFDTRDRWTSETLRSRTPHRSSREPLFGCAPENHRALRTPRSLSTRAVPLRRGARTLPQRARAPPTGYVRADTMLVRLFARRPLGGWGFSRGARRSPDTRLVSLDHSGGEFRRRRGGCRARRSLRRNLRHETPRSPRGGGTRSKLRVQSRGPPPRRSRRHVRRTERTIRQSSASQDPGNGSRGVSGSSRARVGLRSPFASSREGSHPARSRSRDSFVLIAECAVLSGEPLRGPCFPPSTPLPGARRAAGAAFTPALFTPSIRCEPSARRSLGSSTSVEVSLPSAVSR